MAKIEEVDLRLDRWAQWVARGKGGGMGTLAMFNGEPSVLSDPGPRIPLNEEECWQTEKAVLGLPDPLKETVMTYYLSGGFAAVDRLSISRAVLSQRIDRAHKLLRDAWEQKGVLNH